ncbi:hypothetical protein [Paenibacillus sp. YYML68]|uniref:hypothetical protein n=1 Tax=Paenibacillus sp. YYML68 TaxID=2909250 RepID=UPI002491B763|nr:hypothetical protein [Paenibacillus sp. YYML68]
MNRNTNRLHTHLEEIAWIAKLGGVQEHQYRNSLLLSAVIELLQEKGILTLEEITDKARALEQADLPAHLRQDADYKVAP